MLLSLIEDQRNVLRVALLNLALKEAAAMLILAQLVDLTLHVLQLVVGEACALWEIISVCKTHASVRLPTIFAFASLHDVALAVWGVESRLSVIATVRCDRSGAVAIVLLVVR